MTQKSLMPALEGSIMPLGFMRNEYYLALARYQLAGKYAQNKVVLEAGCGAGYGAVELARAGAKKVYAVDNDVLSIQECQKIPFNPKINFAQNDLNRLDFKANTFDLITAFEVVEHSPNYEQLLAGFYRLLKPGGRLILSTPNKAIYSPGTNKPFYPYHFKEFTITELKSVLSDFEIEAIFGEFIRGKKIMIYRVWDPRRLLRIIYANLPQKLKLLIMRSYLAIFNFAYEKSIYRPNKIKRSDVNFSKEANKSRVLVAVVRKPKKINHG